MIKIESIKIPAQYVLVKFNEDHETYQIDGRDTGIRNGLSIDTGGQRMSVTGTVIKIPKQLVYEGPNIKARKAQGLEFHGIREHSMEFDVPMELKEGDEVMYFYKNQLDAYKKGMVIHTDQGPMMMMRYDTIRCIVKSESEDQVYPLNGRIFFVPVKMKSEEQTSSGLTLLQQKHMGLDIKRELSIGRVTEVGCLCSGYRDFHDAGADDPYPIKPGQYIFYDARMSNNLQFETHQTLKTKRAMIHRMSIYGIVVDPTKFEFV